MPDRDPLSQCSSQRKRDARGWFVPGNKAAKSHRHPQARHATKLAEAFRSSIKAADIKAIARKLVQMARKGDLPAIRELLDRTLGRPPQAEPPEFDDQVRLIRYPIAPPAQDGGNDLPLFDSDERARYDG